MSVAVSPTLASQPQKVFTPHGKGRIVYELNDGSVLVEFEEGGGQIYRREDLLLPRKDGHAGRSPQGKYGQIPRGDL